EEATVVDEPAEEPKKVTPKSKSVDDEFDDLEKLINSDYDDISSKETVRHKLQDSLKSNDSQSKTKLEDDEETTYNKSLASEESDVDLDEDVDSLSDKILTALIIILILIIAAVVAMSLIQYVGV
ncbi:MAG: hypothetical protein LUG89_02330, partial [Methanosphaera sp.]|nr:hypothetical protein [Methanosphaera sp.]